MRKFFTAPSHTHDALYAQAVHGHSGYALDTHVHDGYAFIEHTHSEYATHAGSGDETAGQTLSGRLAYGTDQPSVEGAVIGSLYAVIEPTQGGE